MEFNGYEGFKADQIMLRARASRDSVQGLGFRVWALGRSCLRRSFNFPALRQDASLRTALQHCQNLPQCSYGYRPLLQFYVMRNPISITRKA